MYHQARKHYLRSRIERLNETHEHIKKASQFSIDLVTDDDTWGELESAAPFLDMLLKVGIWGGHRLGAIAQAIRQGRPFNVVVGLRPNNLHLGHLLLAQEVSWYVQQGARIYVIIAESEHRLTHEDSAGLHKAANQFIALVRSMCGGDEPNLTIVSDAVDSSIAQAELEIAGLISAHKIHQLFGWDEHTSILRLRSACILAAAFLYPVFLNQSRDLTIVTADINQAPFLEIARMVAQKLKLPPPAATYKALIPNIVGNGRMSISQPKQAIFLGEAEDQLSAKLRKSVTGGCDLEWQRLHGGNPEKCVFLDIISRFIDDESLGNIIAGCISGQATCGGCKQQASPRVARSLAAAAAAIEQQA